MPSSTSPASTCTTPDNGVEVGWIKGPWDAQLAVSNGTAGRSDHHQRQAGERAAAVRRRVAGAPAWRPTSTTPPDSGNRTAYGLFGGLKTGPIAWLAEADIVDDKSLPVGGGQKQLATLLEGNYSPARGHNLKVTFEYLDPDRDVGP